MPSPKAFPSQLNSAGSEPLASNEGLVISNAPLDEDDELDEELLDDEELLEDELLDEELLDEELLLELLEDEELLLELPPHPPIAVASRATLHAKRVLFMFSTYW